MRRRLLLNLALLGLVAVLVGLVIFEPGHQAEQPLPRLSELDPRIITRVRLQPVTGGAIVLRRSEQGWRMIAPLRIAANPVRIRAMLGLLRAPSLAGFRAAGNDLAQYGLDPPRARLRVNDETFEFGDVDPLAGRRYIFHAGQVDLVADSWSRHLTADAAAFVHLALLGPGATPTAIDLPGVRVAQADGRWRREPPDATASADRLIRLVDAWRNARAAVVRPYKVRRAWTDTVRVWIRGAPEPRLFRIARRRYEMVFGWAAGGVEYHLPLAAGERLLNLASAPVGADAQVVSP